MGETKEALLERREQAVKEHYRKAVEEAWADSELSDAEASALRTLASELSLSTDTAADIEREVVGHTIQAMRERNEHATREEERHRRLEDLYTQARRLHRDRKWQAVIDVFEQIRAEDPAYHDREGLLASSREALEAQELARRVATLYAEGQRHMDAREWQQALECFEEVQRLQPGYRETEELLSRVRREATDRTTPERREQLELERRAQFRRRIPRLRARLRERLRSQATSTILQPITDEVHFTVVAQRNSCQSSKCLLTCMSTPGPMLMRSFSGLLSGLLVSMVNLCDIDRRGLCQSNAARSWPFEYPCPASISRTKI